MIIVRKAKDSDIENIHLIEKESFGNFYPKDYIDYLFKKNHIFFIAFSDNIPVGYLCAKIKAANIVHVVSIAVRPNFRNKKIAKRMLAIAHDYFNQNNVNYFFLEVKDTNMAAINLYNSLGYKTFEYRKNYYPDTSGAYLMKKDKDEI